MRLAMMLLVGTLSLPSLAAAKEERGEPYESLAPRQDLGTFTASLLSVRQAGTSGTTSGTSVGYRRVADPPTGYVHLVAPPLLIFSAASRARSEAVVPPPGQVRCAWHLLSRSFP